MSNFWDQFNIKRRKYKTTSSSIFGNGMGSFSWTIAAGKLKFFNRQIDQFDRLSLLEEGHFLRRVPRSVPRRSVINAR